jgi:Na+-transporting NADH:ubiquinone oxidoreductase subunit NqrB
MLEPTKPASFRPSLLKDPRDYQILSLSSLAIYGVFWLSFDVSGSRAAIILGAALATQWLCSRWWGLPKFEARSALISGLSLCLLLRTNFWWLAGAAAVASIASKFIIRWNGKHIFNPTNFGLILLMLLTGRLGPNDPDAALVWVSSGQWGAGALKTFAFACLGCMVIYRAARSDTTLAFIVFYLGIVFWRASWWLGEPISIPLKQAFSGAFLLFAFFMISDPKTTPNTRVGRILFALMVALGAGYIQFRLFRPDGLLWSLAILAPTVPLIDRLLPGQKYEWHHIDRGGGAPAPDKPKQPRERKTMGGLEPIAAAS